MVFKKLLCSFCRFLMVKFPIKGRYRLRKIIIDNGIHAGVDLNIKLFKNAKMRLRLDEYVQQSIFFNNFYERNESELWKKFVLGKKTIFDVGGNVGYYSLLASPLIDRAGKIFMFEPVSINLERAKTNIALSGFSNIYYVKKAITNQVGVLNIRIAESSNLGMSGLASSINLSGNDEQVESITLDEFARQNQIESVDVIKIDVEGAEPLVLQGATNLLTKCSPILMVEVCLETLNRLNFDLADVYFTLSKLGYKPFLIKDDFSLEYIENPISMVGLIVFKKQ